MTRSEIRRLYVGLARALHPDASPPDDGDDDGGGAGAVPARFDDVARAWEVHSDPRSRRAHDRELAAAEFKEGVLRSAGELAREYGPAVRGFYEDVAIPLLR